MRCVREDAAKAPEKAKLFDDLYALLVSHA